MDNVQAIAAKDTHTCALKNDGRVVCWGDNSNGQATPPTELSNVQAIAVGGFHTCALKNDGQVVCWGYNDYGQATPPTGLSNVLAIAAGYRHTCAVKNDGQVVCWGDNYFGQTTVPPITENSAPIANAGLDQEITGVPSIVQLDGSQSYDLEGDEITYNWSFIEKPSGSQASFSNSQIVNPTFQVDVYGIYVIGLVVNDGMLSSESDSMVVTFENIAPVADAGMDQSVVQGDEVCFDGSHSSDANGDSLLYSWTISSAPNTSLVSLDNSTSVTPCMVTDVAGSYTISLTVNDGLVNSEPVSVTVVAIAYLDAITETLQTIVGAINQISPDAFMNESLQNNFSKQINTVTELVDQGQYSEALSNLSGGSILGKVDGCAGSGEPDKNDWIQDCVSQESVHDLVVEVIGYLENL